MNLRRRIALFFDPSLYEFHYRQVEARDLYAIGRSLAEIAKATKSLDAKTTKRRPRVIECRHPELHPEDEVARALVRETAA